MAFSVSKCDIESFLRSHEHIEDPHLFDVGKHVGEWVLTAFIGRGGSGEVYRAKHRLLGVEVAVKILFRTERSAKDRFVREARILSENNVPAFPRFYGYGEVDGRPYLVTELLEYYPLPCRDAEAAAYLMGVCEGVQRLHELGFVHRDIKPQNILRRPSTNSPVLIDLGLVKDVRGPMIRPGALLSVVEGKAVGVGTLRYSAPEQFSGGDVSPASDIHALGMLANECFGGKPSSAWSRIIRRSTSSIPSQRYENVVAFVRAVRFRFLKECLGMLAFVSVVVAIAAVYLYDPKVLELRRSEVTHQENRSRSSDSAFGGDVSAGAIANVSDGLGGEENASVAQDHSAESGAASSATSSPNVPAKEDDATSVMKLEWTQKGSYSGDTVVDRDF